MCAATTVPVVYSPTPVVTTVNKGSLLADIAIPLLEKKEQEKLKKEKAILAALGPPPASPVRPKPANPAVTPGSSHALLGPPQQEAEQG